MPGHDIVVIGASAGGVEALTRLVQNLPANLGAAIFVVLHIPSSSSSALPQILSRHGRLTARHPQPDEPIRVGSIYIAPPDLHLLLHKGTIRLARGPRENGHRPAIDPLFRSAALAYGPRVVGIILSGTREDGTAGLQAIKTRGGVTVVQDPEEALYSGMPQSAIENVEPNSILPVSEIASLIACLTQASPQAGIAPITGENVMEEAMTEMDIGAIPEEAHPGKPSSYGCPDCGGTLWEIHDGDLVRFRCRVGHAWSAGSLLIRQSDALEDAFWTALRALEENMSLARRLQERAERQGRTLAAERFAGQAERAQEQADLIRALLLQGKHPVEQAE